MNEEPRWRDVDPREGYDQWASSYDDEGNPLLALEEPEADKALGDVAGLDVLDAGTGTGRHAIRLAARGARVTAIDFSDGMLAKARAKAGADRVRFETHDVTRRLPYADASFDRLLSALVLEHVARALLAEGFREIATSMLFTKELAERVEERVFAPAVVR